MHHPEKDGVFWNHWKLGRFYKPELTPLLIQEDIFVCQRVNLHSAMRSIWVCDWLHCIVGCVFHCIYFRSSEYLPALACKMLNARLPTPSCTHFQHSVELPITGEVISVTTTKEALEKTTWFLPRKLERRYEWREKKKTREQMEK